MIQNCTQLKVMDNSGVKKTNCFKIIKSKYNKNAGYLGDLIKVSIREIKTKNETNIKKGDVYNALIVKTKKEYIRFSGQNFKFDNNYVILLNNDLNPIGTRIFGILPKELRKTNIKLLMLSSIII